ncbi:O-antigen ligase-related protein [Acididesulfobacillus acetoxydans]|uniref:O-antigen ligase-related protein n=1 Tax=Acididesulfobacillus acetoxydans TaxID=1561005 RepID=A0A8S0W1N6_9FIRM|nr:O-antigen ligase family protein [Acididesulfobacillus acetoxydans]CAA7599628.1 O-antigen ligase-related protein [Acididesulfobacillus acetoxydans]CEJ06461.1 O-antigen polymerase [Acididesulfobacillus acetoxydans]
MSWILLILAVALVIGGWCYPRLLVPLLIAALPLEISRTWFPRLKHLEKLGTFVGMVDLGRIMALAVVLYFLYTTVRSHGPWARYGGFQDSFRAGTFPDRSRAGWRDRLFSLSGIYILYGLLSVIWSVDRLHTLTGVVRLGLLWVLGLAVYRILTEERDYWLVPQSFAAVGTALAGVGVYEMVSRHFLWLGQIYQVLHRYNATFVDANIYARFLVLGMLATSVWLLNTVPRAGRVIGYLALAIQLAALLGTGSRTGWAACGLAFILLAVLVPRKPVYVILAGAILLGGVVLLVDPAVFLRIQDLRHGLLAASTERSYLWQAGWDMFVKHPLFGVGLGGFQKVMLTRYASVIRNGVSLSHTALMTTAAELGIIGVSIVLAFLLVLLARAVRAGHRLRVGSDWSESYPRALLTIFAVLGVFVVFVSAQGEGRFWEDPYLWILLGLLGALAGAGEVT